MRWKPSVTSWSRWRFSVPTVLRVATNFGFIILNTAVFLFKAQWFYPITPVSSGKRLRHGAARGTTDPLAPLDSATLGVVDAEAQQPRQAPLERVGEAARDGTRVEGEARERRDRLERRQRARADVGVGEVEILQHGKRREERDAVVGDAAILREVHDAQLGQPREDGDALVGEAAAADLDAGAR